MEIEVAVEEDEAAEEEGLLVDAAIGADKVVEEVEAVAREEQEAVPK